MRTYVGDDVVIVSRLGWVTGEDPTEIVSTTLLVGSRIYGHLANAIYHIQVI